jgi:hypothetical protein
LNKHSIDSVFCEKNSVRTWQFYRILILVAVAMVIVKVAMIATVYGDAVTDGVGVTVDMDTAIMGGIIELTWSNKESGMVSFFVKIDRLPVYIDGGSTLDNKTLKALLSELFRMHRSANVIFGLKDFNVSIIIFELSSVSFVALK